MLAGGTKWTSKGRVAKIYETPLGEVLLERHLYQSSAGGKTICPLEEKARITGGSATPQLLGSLPEDSLLIGDRLYGVAKFLVLLKEAFSQVKGEFLVRVRCNLKPR